MHVSLGSPLGRAPAVAGERVVVATICPLRRLRRHLSQRERLFANSIITKIGRENNSSAEIYMCIRRGDLRSPAGEHSSPLPCSENILMRRSVSGDFFGYSGIYAPEVMVSVPNSFAHSFTVSGSFMQNVVSTVTPVKVVSWIVNSSVVP